MVFELGLSGGIATMYQDVWDHQTRSSIFFSYHSTDKYCPNGKQAPARPRARAPAGPGSIGRPLTSSFPFLSVGLSFPVYFTKDACHALFVAGTIALTFLSLAVVSGFCSAMLLVVVALQLSHLLAERGPFGPYVNYARCWRNCIAGTNKKKIKCQLFSKSFQRNRSHFHLLLTQRALSPLQRL